MGATNNQLEIVQFAAAAQDALDTARATIEAAPSDAVRILTTRLPVAVEGESGPLKVVFAGQYNAGKSSVIKALTGRDDIPIGAKITTQDVTSYQWSGITIVDTPGIHTSLRPDHDELSYRALSEADLVVFVVSNELFDDHLADQFRKLAIDRDKGHEMLLLVNKMSRHALGNSVEARDTAREDLRKVVAPFTTEDLGLAFTDAKSALDAEEADSEKAKSLLRRRSAVDEFANNLNNFVREKGLAARYTTSLYVLEQVLQEALTKESSGDHDVDGLEEMLLQKRRALVEEQQKLPDVLGPIVTSEVESVRQDGRRISGALHGNFDPQQVNDDLNSAQLRAEEVVETVSRQIQQVLGERIDALESRIEGIMQSELARELLPRLAARVADTFDKTPLDPQKQQALVTGADLSQRLGKFLISKSFAPSSPSFQALFKLKSYSGTDTHKAILAIGKALGKKFKPWEAVKWTKYAAHTGRVLGVFGVGLSVYMTWRQDQAEADREKEMAGSRAAIRAGFADAAHQIEAHFDKVTATYITEIFAPEIKRVDQDLDELRALQDQRGEHHDTLIGLLKRTQGLIREAHNGRVDTPNPDEISQDERRPAIR